MPHFKITIDPPAIVTTGEALGPDVWPSLKMARAMLEARVADELIHAANDCGKGVYALRQAYNERVRDLRAARNIALRVRETDLASDIPSSAPSPQCVAVSARVAPAEVHQAPPEAEGRASAATENGGDAPSAPSTRVRETSDDAPAGDATAGRGDAPTRGYPTCEHPEKERMIVRTSAESGIYCRQCGNRIGDAPPSDDLLSLEGTHLQRPKPRSA